MNKWTSLYVKENGEMKRIGNVNPSTGAVVMYFQDLGYYDSSNLCYVDEQGLYQQFT